jgi:hypothetical protein
MEAPRLRLLPWVFLIAGLVAAVVVIARVF